MSKQVVVITGGAQGIGKAIAHRFLLDGFAVVIADVDEEAGLETATEYASLGAIRFVRANVASAGRRVPRRTNLGSRVLRGMRRMTP